MNTQLSIQQTRVTRLELCDIFVMCFLFLASLNFVTRYYYWIYIAFAIFVFTSGRKIFINMSTGFLFLLGVSMLIFDYQNIDTIIGMFKPFVFMISYMMGTGLELTQGDFKRGQNRIKQIIFLTSLGLFLHFLLNAFTNLGALDRNTIDIWTGSILSATSQSSLACLCVAIVAAALFSDVSFKYKFLAIAVLILIVIYNMVLAGRTLPLMLLLVLVFASLHSCFYHRSRYIRAILIFVAIIFFTVVLYDIDFLNMRTAFENSNFYYRFLGAHAENITDDPRLFYKYVYIKNFLNYPWGGEHIHSAVGFYAHDLYLDCFDQCGIFGFIAIIGYVFSSFLRFWRCFKSQKLFPFWLKQLVCCVYLVINLQFWVEPIIKGMPWIFIVYCLIDGAVASYLRATQKEASLEP